MTAAILADDALAGRLAAAEHDVLQLSVPEGKSPASALAACLIEFEQALAGREADAVVVEGDSDAALALALVAAKLELPVGVASDNGASDSPAGRVIALLADPALQPGAVPTIPGS
jgi:hypothetical protein